ncbi:site-specific integrase [Vibrio rotiferianus]|uniref:site-specific integrase n=1 Tax=Vibrio rotiferianus TaxID=190895 RepID=UPI0005EF9096|nr:site-specific integrase [Vibrio rotiferianus]
MALPPIIDNQSWLFKVTENQSKEPEMALCLLGFFIGTGLRTIELGRIQVQDIFSKSGKLNKKLVVRGDNERTVFLVNKKLKELIFNYAEKRPKDGQHPDRYNGFDPDAPLFVRRRYGEFRIQRKETDKGRVTYYCPSLNTYIKKLLTNSGIENASIESGRRTFALRLKGKVDLASIHKALGNKDINTMTG